MELAENSQAARIARFGYMRWFTAMEAIIALKISQPHPRILDIRAAGGSVTAEPIELDGVKCHRYMVTKLPSIRGESVSVPTSGVGA